MPTSGSLSFSLGAWPVPMRARELRLQEPSGISVQLTGNPKESGYSSALPEPKRARTAGPDWA